MDAGNRGIWRRDQDERPLSDLGQRQADAIADALIDEYEIRALFASPALRARQTLEPLAARLGLPIQIEPLLAEKQLGEDRTTLAERGMRALEAIRSVMGEGVAIAASHGDIIPATVVALGGTDALERRGQWYEIVVDDAGATVTLRQAANFPL